MTNIGKGYYEPIHGAVGEEVSEQLVPSNGRKFKRCDLDTIFRDLYTYHQSGGFWVLLLEEVLWVVKLVFVVFIGIELSVCTRWEVLANRSVPVASWTEVFTPPDQCWSSLPLLPALFTGITFTALSVHCVTALLRLQRFWQIRRFSTRHLGLPTGAIGLGDLTWSEVQKRLIDSQHYPGLDEWGVYHRILRQENYLIAMVDQEVLPIRFKIALSNPPWPYVYLSNGYLFNLKMLLFWTRWSPFTANNQLLSEYKEFSRRHELAASLANMSRALGVLNLLFSPIILFAQVLIFACSNAERLRYQPASVLGRSWSNYGKLYLRHYNELNHQLATRVSRAYLPASQYLDSFTSRNIVVLAEAGAYVFGSLSVAFLLFGMIHDQMMHLPGYWFILVCGGLLARACIAVLPDEHVVYSPKHLLVTVLGGIHRVRDDWIQHSTTYRVRCEFAELFQYRLTGLLEELFSPIITPFLLLFVVPNYTLSFVDFLRNYTVELHGVGDVCSFAQLDVLRHGDPSWMMIHGDNVSSDDLDVPDVTGSGSRADGQPRLARKSSIGGKTELSLMCFHLNNPSCELPPSSRAMLLAIRAQLLRDLQQQQLLSTGAQDQHSSLPMTASQQPLSTAGLFSSLYGEPGGTTSQLGTPICRAVPRLRNASVLPGPACIPSGTLGFVGAMTESMKSSTHQSDPEMTASSASVTTVTKQAFTSGAGATTPGKTATTSKLPPAHEHHTEAETRLPNPFARQQLYFEPTASSDPINMSMMAASVLCSAETSGHVSYAPYVSQIDDQSGQFWGFSSTAIGSSVFSGRHTMSDLFTADQSASILYMHELAQRRRQRRQEQTRPERPFGQFPQPSRSYHQCASSQLPHGGPVSPGAVHRLMSPPTSSMSTSAFTRRQPSTVVAGSNNSRPVNEQTSLVGADASGVYGYGATAGEQLPGRPFTDAPRFVRPPFAGVTEEDEISATPRMAHREFNLPGYRTPDKTHEPAGVVTVSGSPTPRQSLAPMPPLPAAATPQSLTSDHVTTADIVHRQPNTEHIWPDLPPTD